MRKKLPILGIIIGVMMIAAYPVYDAYNTWKGKEVIDQLDEQVSQMTIENKEEMLEQARAYNDVLARKNPRVSPVLPYKEQLNPDKQDTAFAELVIPQIAIDMPVFHGASEAVLSAGVGHLERSSLPVGGEDTHCILTAHSGMKGMRAFDDLKRLKKGGVFAVKVLGDYYAYRIYDTKVVLPEEIDMLDIQKGRDLCTLITCTPYGVNTHRLLVFGERCPMPDDFFKQKPKLKDIVLNRRYIGLFAAAIILLLLLIAAIRRRIRKRRKHRRVA